MKWLVRILVSIMILLTSGTALAQDATPTPVTTRGAVPDSSGYVWTEFAGGFSRPLLMIFSPDGTGRLFVLEQGGTISIIQNGQRLPAPFLDVTGLLSRDVNGGGYTERGLLGLAFHPDFAQNGLFFINHTDQRGNTVVARYSISAGDPNAADTGSRAIILTVEQPFANHNGGMMAFGPDGYLYIGMGDGGSAGDPLGAGQNPGTLLGKLLRIDVNTAPYVVPSDNPFVGDAAYAPEIWALGLRNPWRFSFDRATGDLYIADVGQNQWEEVNFQPAGVGGQNYGWNAYEATHRYPGANPTDDMVMPFAEYEHSQGCSVTGGYVYRGAALPDLQGVYFYGDWCTGNLWAAYRDTSGAWQSLLWMTTPYNISAFAEDEAGELYLVDYSGQVLRLTAAG